MSNLKQKNRELQYYFYRGAMFLPTILGWVYFNFLLLRSADDFFAAVPLVFQSYGVLFTGMLAGFIVSASLINRIGYKNNYRIAYFFDAVALIFAFFNVDRILDIYLVVSLIRGLGSAFYWMGTNTYMLREQSGMQRETSISMIFSGQYLLEIVLPAIGGLIVQELNYGVLFLISGLICLLVMIAPTGKNLIPEGKFAWGEIFSFTGRRGFKRLTAAWLIHEMVSNQRAMIFAFLPFLLIGDELNTGLYLSAVGVVAAVISFLHRRDDDKHQLQNGFIGSTLVTLSTTLLVFTWSVPFLFVREIFAKIGFSLYHPVHMNLENQVEELFVGSFLKESAVEMAFFREVILITARIFNFMILMLIFYVVNVNVELTLRVIVLITAIREFFFLYSFNWLKSNLKIGSKLALA